MMGPSRVSGMGLSYHGGKGDMDDLEVGQEERILGGQSAVSGSISLL